MHDQLLTVEELAPLLKRKPSSIRRDLWRNPASLPPRVIVPGSNRLRWSRDDVDAWLAALARANTKVSHE